MRINQNLCRAFSFLMTACVTLLAVGAASASITIATVPVGNAGNAPDPSTGYGQVNYNYNIGEYDVTSSQYTAFLNAVAATDTYGLYTSGMSGTTAGYPGIIQSGSSGSFSYSVVSGYANRPVSDVTFWDALRFANWLENGQPTGPEGSGTTETGTYTLTPTAIADNTVTRNPGSTWALTSENEWYKAAYYSPTLNGGAGGYWLYPTQSNTISTTQANYNESVDHTTAVGSYPYPSYYGTYDQGGNVFQWDESIVNSGSDRVTRGGSFDSPGTYLQSDVNTYDFPPTNAIDVIGFRVVQIPEPASAGLLSIGALVLLAHRRRNLQR
jgi:sulfatase modifying factor 1